jgi:hypothetical protein
VSYVDELAESAPSRRTSCPMALFRLYAVLASAKGEHVVLEDVHDAWAA